MKSSNAQRLRQSYELQLLQKMQNLLRKRAKVGISQSKMALLVGVSLRTIQRFESYNLIDAYLVFAYGKVLA